MGITRVIAWSISNRLLVLAAAVLIAAWGLHAARTLPLDAIPDISDVQVIVKTPWMGQPPQVVEDQVTYPLAAILLSVPGTQAVRGFSMFGESYLYVVFEDGTDPYWARARVLEYLSQAAGRLPPGVTPSLGPDASGVGWVFQYALVDRQHKHDIDELRVLQDFFLRYELQALPGVAEVASVGGATRQFQVEVDPQRLAAYGLSLAQVQEAVRQSNLAGGGGVVEMGHAEYMVRLSGYLRTLEDLGKVPLGMNERGAPVRLTDVAHIHTGPDARRGVTDLDGQGEVAGGIVVMRHGQNALEVIERVKGRLEELRRSLPEGVELTVTYDRSQLIGRAIDTLHRNLLEESLAVAAVCLLFLVHLRSSLVAIVTLPLGILAAFVVMKLQGVNANIMSLGGIAIAIGAMVDAAVVMIENMMKHLERASPDEDRWAVVRRATQEVGPALFFSLLVITVSFLPIFALTGQEGKLFSPLAYTKTYAMAASAALAVTLVPVLMGYLIRGRIVAEVRNPLNRGLQAAYRPVLEAALGRRRWALALCALLMASAVWPWARLGSEFMPPLDEGDLLFMPTTLPGLSIDEAANILQVTDRLIARFPEVERVLGKAGRADTATDPAPLSMLETTILLKPREAWPAGGTTEELIARLDREVSLPGLTNAWGYPIRTRIDMLSTGIRTPVGVKVTGPDLQGIVRLAERIEAVLKPLPGTRSVFAERVASGRYIDVAIDRERALRWGVRAADIQRVVQGAIGGENVSTLIAGRERFSVNVRYPRGLRDSPEAISASLVSTGGGGTVPLREVAEIRVVDGPAEVKSENGRLVGYVYVDVDGRDLGGYLAAARKTVAEKVPLEPGYAVAWSGQYENIQRAKARLLWVVPLTLALVAGLLAAWLRDATKVALVLLSLPFALSGAFWLVWALGYNLSVAVAVGFIALAGVAAEFGVVMLLYLDLALDEFRAAGRLRSREDLHQAIVQGALKRIRPKIMAVAAILAGLLPIMLTHTTGADVMQRIAAPMIGGMLTAPLLSLIVIPVLYAIWQERRLGRSEVR